MKLNGINFSNYAVRKKLDLYTPFEDVLKNKDNVAGLQNYLKKIKRSSFKKLCSILYSLKFEDLELSTKSLMKEQTFTDRSAQDYILTIIFILKVLSIKKDEEVKLNETNNPN